MKAKSINSIVPHFEPAPFMQCMKCQKFFALKFQSVEKIKPCPATDNQPTKLVHFCCKHCQAKVEYFDIDWPYFWL